MAVSVCPHAAMALGRQGSVLAKPTCEAECEAPITECEHGVHTRHVRRRVAPVCDHRVGKPPEVLSLGLLLAGATGSGVVALALSRRLLGRIIRLTAKPIQTIPVGKKQNVGGELLVAPLVDIVS